MGLHHDLEVEVHLEDIGTLVPAVEWIDVASEVPLAVPCIGLAEDVAWIVVLAVAVVETGFAGILAVHYRKTPT